MSLMLGFILKRNTRYESEQDRPQLPPSVSLAPAQLTGPPRAQVHASHAYGTLRRVQNTMQLCFDSSRTMFSIAIAGRHLKPTADKQASSHRQHQVADAQAQRSSRRPMPRLNLHPSLYHLSRSR
mmetsp:Transcript_9762/g.32399  ORF Transcript_9762/g.32399 Transcript_9762/m.32399 type:complete len:125 (+) Transcript_9762:47-421(+)